MAVHGYMSWVVAALSFFSPALASLIVIASFSAGGVAVRPEVVVVVDALSLLGPGDALLVSVSGVAVREDEHCRDDKEAQPRCAEHEQ